MFDVQKSDILKHLKNICKSGELAEASVVSKLETTAADCKRANLFSLGGLMWSLHVANLPDELDERI